MRLHCGLLSYIEDADPLYCDNVTKCEACPDGMVCGKQQDFTLANLNETFYRVDTTSLNVVKCPDPATQCVGNATHVRLPPCSFLIATLYRRLPLITAFCTPPFSLFLPRFSPSLLPCTFARHLPAVPQVVTLPSSVATLDHPNSLHKG